MRVAGLAPVENIPGLENIDVTQFVNGHMAYRAAMPRLLREVGWEVESDEFTEIEDPDPDNHEKRQRELIRELDEARKDAESKGGKRRFGLFKREKLAKKKGWETYDDSMRDGSAAAGTNGEGASSNGANGGGDAGANVLFDIDAIRAELASEMIEVKQLESTLPPMKLEINGAKSNAEWNESHTRPPPGEPGLHDDGRLGRAGDTTLAMRPAPADIDNSDSKKRNSNPFDRGYDEYIVSPISPAATTTNGSFPVSNTNTNRNDISPIDSNTNTNTNTHNISTTNPLPSPHWPSSSSFSYADARTHSNPSVPTTSSTKTETDIPENESSTPRLRRPTLMTANTLPTHTSASTSDMGGFGVEHNAWLDEDEFAGDGEGGVRMTFG